MTIKDLATLPPNQGGPTLSDPQAAFAFNGVCVREREKERVCVSVFNSFCVPNIPLVSFVSFEPECVPLVLSVRRLVTSDSPQGARCR